MTGLNQWAPWARATGRARTARPYIVVGAFALYMLGCGNAGEDLGFAPLGNGTVAAFIYLDRNGDLNPSPGQDTAFAGVRLGLVVPGTPDTVFSALTDPLGNVVFSNVPFGSYRFVVDDATVGDSIDVQAIDPTDIQLSGNARQQLVVVRLGFPLLTVAQARIAPALSRVIVKGVMLAGLGTFADTTANLIESGVAIRLTGAVHTGPASQPGDSVRVLGTVLVRGGQPVLDQAAIGVFNLGFASPPATPLSTLLAANASAGSQDAALVRLSGAIVTDTATVGADYHVGLDDGSGRVLMVLDNAGDFPAAIPGLVPGASVTGDGILVPTGTGIWIFKPRTEGDLTVS